MLILWEKIPKEEFNIEKYDNSLEQLLIDLLGNNKDLIEGLLHWIHIESGDVKEIYTQRPQHIERVFADGKMKFGLRKTYFKGKQRVHRELTLLYACMNLKKFALHHYA